MMIEITVIDYLSETLSVHVSIETPKGEKEDVLIDRTGGSEKNKIKSALKNAGF